MPVQGELACMQQLRSIYQKASTNRQPALIRLLLHLPHNAVQHVFISFGIPQKGDRAAAGIQGCSATGCFYCSLKKHRGLPSQAVVPKT
jgi:hypothetical protein